DSAVCLPAILRPVAALTVAGGAEPRHQEQTVANASAMSVMPGDPTHLDCEPRIALPDPRWRRPMARIRRPPHNYGKRGTPQAKVGRDPGGCRVTHATAPAIPPKNGCPADLRGSRATDWLGSGSS